MEAKRGEWAAVMVGGMAERNAVSGVAAVDAASAAYICRSI